MTYTRQFEGNSIVLWAEMDAICDWLRANDITPGDVPIDAAVTLDRRNMTVDVYLRTPDGALVLERHRDEVARGRLTVPIRRRPPVLASLSPARRKRAIA